MSVALKNGCIFFVIVLLMPVLQRSLKILPRMQLHGVQVEAKKPDMTWKTWMDGSFQRDYEKYFNQRQGLRAHLISLHNQIHYQLFNTVADGRGTALVLGENGFIYERPYIDLYNKSNKHSIESLRSIARQVRFLQDELHKIGVAFLLVISPSKVEIYPEHVPEGLLKPGRKHRFSTYDEFVPILREQGVELIDAKEAFIHWKRTEQYPLFPKTGTHWNYVGAGRVVGLIMESLSRQLGKSFPGLELVNVRCDDVIQGDDNDLGFLLNLWTWKQIAGVQYHPVFHRSAGNEKDKPDILIVGDSFCHTLVDILHDNELVEDTDLFFYFKRLFDSQLDETGISIRRDNLDWWGDIFRHDAIILQLNEYWLPKVGFGFLEAALAVLNYPDALDREVESK